MKEGGTKQTLEIHSRACYQYNQLQEDDGNGEIKDGEKEDGEDSIQKKNQQLLKKRTKKSKKKKSSDQIKKSDMIRDLKFYQVCFLSFLGFKYVITKSNFLEEYLH